MEAGEVSSLTWEKTHDAKSRTRPRKSTVGALYAVGGMDVMKGNRSNTTLTPLIVKAVLKFVEMCTSKANFINKVI